VTGLDFVAVSSFCFLQELWGSTSQDVASFEVVSKREEDAQPAAMSLPPCPAAVPCHPVSEVCVTGVRKTSFLEKSGCRKRTGFVTLGYLIVCLWQ